MVCGRRACLFLLASTILASTSPVDASWTQQGGDAARTAQADAGPIWDDVALQVHLTGGALWNAPVIVGGFAYVLTQAIPGNSALGDRGIWRIELATGHVKLIVKQAEARPSGWQTWDYEYADSFGSDGTLLFVTDGVNLEAYHMDGKSAWTLQLPTKPDAERSACNPPAVAAGSIWLACQWIWRGPAQSVTAPGVVSTDGFSSMEVAVETYVVRVDTASGKQQALWDHGQAAAQLPASHPSAADAVNPPRVDAFNEGLTVIGNRVLVPLEEVDSSAYYYNDVGQPGNNFQADGGTSREGIWALDSQDLTLQWVHSQEYKNAIEQVGPAGTVPVLTEPIFKPSLATGQGGLAFYKADGVVAVNIEDGSTQPPVTVGVGDSAPRDYGLQMAFGDGGLFVAKGTTLTRLNATDRQRDWDLALPLADNETFAPLDRAVAGGVLYTTTYQTSHHLGGFAYPHDYAGFGAVYALDAATGSILWRHALPSAGPVGEPGWKMQLMDYRMAVADGVLVAAGRQGDVIIIGQTAASPQPRATVSDGPIYPGTNVEVDLSGSVAGAGGPAVAYRVDWGDGNVTGWQQNATSTHQYRAAGHPAALFQVRNAAGQTATVAHGLEVMAPPPIVIQAQPIHQNALQFAFSEKNQAFTFFGLGVIVSLLGAAYAGIRVRRGRTGLRRELGALDAIMAANTHDGVACETALAERGARARGLLLSGRMDEAKYGVIKTAIDERLRTLRVTEFSQVFAHLPANLSANVRSMLSDGRIDDREMEAFRRLVMAASGLSKGRREDVLRLVGSWASRDAAM